MKAKIELNGPKIRLLMAVCLCFFLFVATTPTTPSEGNGCSSEIENGRLLVNNLSASFFYIDCVGPDGKIRLGKLEAYTQAEFILKPGYYTYKLTILTGELMAFSFKRGDFRIRPPSISVIEYQK